jgi:chromosomal replication initiation ATPase DnaA
MQVRVDDGAIPVSSIRHEAASMLIQVSTPTSVAELRALYRRTRAHFAAAQIAAETRMAAAPPPTRHPTPPTAPPRTRFSGRTTLRVVARHFGVAPAALAGAVRQRHLAVARWIVLHICVAAGGWTTVRAGRLLGRSHSTVIYGLRELAALTAHDAAVAEMVAQLARHCVPDGTRVRAGEGGA